MKNEFQDIKVYWDIEVTWLIKWYFNTPQWYLLNWKIVPSVASNNLTLALKTLAGTDPSITDPVDVRIWGVMRRITSALSVTKNAWTNWFNAWSTELATFEVDYFAYIGWNATIWITIWFSRIPFWRQYGDFSATTTNEKYCAISNITSATSADYYENVWRFWATLSAGAWYTWTVPAFTAVNMIDRPIYETRWLSCSPQFSSGGWMTIASVVKNGAIYKLTFDTCKLNCKHTMTTWVAGFNQIYMTTPFWYNYPNICAIAWTWMYYNGANLYNTNVFLNNATANSLTSSRYDNANFALGASQEISVCADYRI